MSNVRVITPSNLGQEFDLGVIEQGKIHVKVDGTTITRDANGVLSSVGTVVESSNTSKTTKNIAAIKDAGGNVIGNIKETVTAVVSTLNEFTFTNELGVENSITKVSDVSLTVDAVAKTLKTTINGVESTAVDISALYADTNLIFDSYANYILTFHTEQGSPVTINLEDLLPVVVQNTTTTSITGNGTSSSPLAVALKVSTAIGNILEVDSQGLYAKINVFGDDGIIMTGDGRLDPISVGLKLNPSGESLLTLGAAGLNAELKAYASASIDLRGAGNAGSPLEADVLISATAGNALSINPDGLYVSVPAQKGLGSGSNGIFVDELGNDYVVGIRLADEGGNMLSQGSAGLKAVLNKQDSDTITLGGNGGFGIAGGGFGGGTPLQANVRIKNASMSNILSSSVDGLSAEIVTTSSETADLSGAGTQSSPLQVDVKISQAPGNLLEDNGGLRVSDSAVAALATVQVEDAFGTPIYMAFPVV